MPFVFHQHGKVSAIPAASRQPPNYHSRLVADSTEPHLAAALVNSFKSLQNSLTDRVIYSGMANGSLLTAIQPQLAVFDKDLAATKFFLANAHLQSNTIMSNRLRGNVRKASSFQFDLGALPQSTQDALDDYDFGMIRQIDDDTRSVVSNVIQRGVQQGWAPSKMARYLRGSIGLTDTQEAAVVNYQTMLENGNPDALNRLLRDQRSDGAVQSSIDGTRPLAPDQVARLVQGYQDRYLSYRANAIARYESLSASNSGSMDAVQDAINAGQLDPDNVITTWMIADDEITCPLCRSIIELQPDGVPFGQPFDWRTMSKGKRGHPKAGQVLLAPAHTFCRCVNGVRILGRAESPDDSGYDDGGGDDDSQYF